MEEEELVKKMISGSHTDSEDIVQDTFVACYLNREQPADELYPENTAAPGELLESLILREEENAICAAIKELPVKQRTVIVLYYYNQMTIKEIAKICGCQEGTVKSHLFNGKARLKAMLTENEKKGGTTWTILS